MDESIFPPGELVAARRKVAADELQVLRMASRKGSLSDAERVATVELTRLVQSYLDAQPEQEVAA